MTAAKGKRLEVHLSLATNTFHYHQQFVHL